MRILNTNDWQAQWITFGTADAGSTLLRRGFAVGSGLKRAWVNVCGLGQYEMTLNGVRVGADFLSPGWTTAPLMSTWTVLFWTAARLRFQPLRPLPSAWGWNLTVAGTSRMAPLSSGCVRSDSPPAHSTRSSY
jgi:hypothetical protein